MKVMFSDDVTVECQSIGKTYEFWVPENHKLGKFIAKTINKKCRSPYVREVGYDFSDTGFRLSDEGKEILTNRDYTCDNYSIKMFLLLEEIEVGMSILRLELRFSDILEYDT